MEALTLELRSAEAPTIKSTLADSSTYVLGQDGAFEPEGTTRATAALRLITEGHQIYVEPGPDGNLLVNGKASTGRIAVHHGDWVTVGNVVYQVKLGERAAGPAQAPAAGPLVVIGRAPECTLSIDSPNVSRRHARLQAAQGQWILEDLGSMNGTFVNGQRIDAPVTLKSGDRISFASFAYRFTGDGLIADGG
ncbi:MAG: FHA domain-containing protein [Gammaproteobacteria bacterium]|nr:FHA domain-containing protein [Gammaproteobacteria bacterium]